MAAAALSSRLPSITDYARQAHQPTFYARLDGDWWVAVADVIASTKLAGQGRDREVNFVAGAVVAVLGTLASHPDQPAASQFGGDGGVAVVPPDRAESCRCGLAALGHWAQAEMNIPLRVGMVPVRALLDAGHETLAALQDFGNGNVFGQFLGRGVSTAEHWVKSDPRWSIPPQEGALPGLEELSCRWKPVPAQRGKIHCYLIDPIIEGVLPRLNAGIESIIPTALAGPLGTGESLRPVVVPSAHALAVEARTVSTWQRPARYAKAIIGSAILGLVHRMGGRLGRLNTDHYRRALAERSDYRRQCGGPRYVLDLTPDEAQAIETLLDRYEAQGELLYGTAQSEATSLTCMVGDFAADRHVHFVDGLGLGFWRASVQLKEKMRAAALVGNES